MRLHVSTMLKASKQHSWPIKAVMSLDTGKVKLYYYKNNHYTYITTRINKESAKVLLHEYELIISIVEYTITL
jgi:hypothetical protein